MIYSAFKERGNGLLNEDRVARFSVTTLQSFNAARIILVDFSH
jgi:hypothetical protein